jgi:LysM repeat protein
VSVRTPKPSLQKVTVASGDTLWGLGIRNSRTWEQLWRFNLSAVPNPNLIFVGQVLTIPPATFDPGPVSVPAQRVSTPAPAPVAVSHSSPVVQPAYTQPTVHHTYVAPQPVHATYSGGASSSFKSCVEFRESTDGAGSSNLYGILNSTWSSLGLPGSAYTASPGEQSAAFDQLYAKDGASPWRPYDGC